MEYGAIGAGFLCRRSQVDVYGGGRRDHPFEATVVDSELRFWLGERVGDIALDETREASQGQIGGSKSVFRE
jgi:hypothetical protein